MPYRKFQADYLFTGYKMLNNNHVLVTDEDGVVKDIIPYDEAGDDVMYLEGILSPGFINCHCHLELSHMKGLIPQHTDMVDFLIQVMQKRNHAEKEILSAITQAETEMIRNGIVAVGDICNTPFSLQQKLKGNIKYFNFIEATGFIPEYASSRFESIKSVYDVFAQYFPNKSSIVPHAPYSVSKELLELINDFSYQKIISIHNQESQAENNFFIHGNSDFKRLYKSLGADISFYHPSRKSSIQTYLPSLNHTGEIILVHNTFIKKEDLRFVQQLQENTGFPEVYYCICANANLYIENTLPEIDLLLSHNCNIVLGTDSLSSNNELNILSEINTIKNAFPEVSIENLLKWATINGAKALRMDNELGSFDIGKKPGIIQLKNLHNSEFSVPLFTNRIL